MEKKSDNPEKKIKKEYVAPEVLEVFELDAEVRILASSSVVTEETEVVSTGAVCFKADGVRFGIRVDLSGGRLLAVVYEQF